MMRLVNKSNLTEILQYREPHFSGFFRMELHSENVVSLDGAGKLQIRIR